MKPGSKSSGTPSLDQMKPGPGLGAPTTTSGIAMSYFFMYFLRQAGEPNFSLRPLRLRDFFAFVADFFRRLRPEPLDRRMVGSAIAY